MKAKRSLGQNFFVNKNLGDHIIDIVAKESNTNAVEIGPGLGFFTERLNSKFENLTVIEKDSELAQDLGRRFPNIKVLNSDILDINLEELNLGNPIYF